MAGTSTPRGAASRWAPPHVDLGRLAIVAASAVVCGLYLLLPLMPTTAEWMASGGPVSLPSANHLLGTDPRGRDLLQALVMAQAVFVPMALRAWLVGLGLGCAVGLVGGLGPRPLAIALDRLCVTLAAFPRLPLILLVATAFDPSLATAAIAVGVTFVPDVAHESRTRIDALRRSAFFTASQAHGIGWLRLIGHHVLRLHLGPMLARQAAFVFAFVVIAEAGLSYLATLGRYPIIGETGARVRFGDLLVEAKSFVDPTFTEAATWWPLAVEAGYLALLVGCALAIADRIGRTIEG